jgi:hypothetical protein
MQFLTFVGNTYKVKESLQLYKNLYLLHLLYSLYTLYSLYSLWHFAGEVRRCLTRRSVLPAGMHSHAVLIIIGGIIYGDFV